MKTIAVKLPDHLLAEIQDAAKKRGETRSAVMREASRFLFVWQRIAMPAPASILPVISPDASKARPIFQRIRRT